MGYFAYFVIISALVGISALAVYYVYAQRLSRVSGWDDLALRYPAESEPRAKILKYQTLMVGNTKFNKSVSFCATEDGLYLSSWFTRHALLIPWYDLRRGKEASMGSQKGYLINIGESRAGTLTLPMQLYILVQTHTEHKRY